MRRALQVYLGDGERLVGALRFEAQGAKEFSAFTYDDAWLAARDGFALEPELALARGPQFHKKARAGSVFHAIIADSEPGALGRQRRHPGGAH